MKILLNTNVYEIPERLKEVDDGYFVVFDTDRQKYEVHNRYNIGGTYCLTVPFDELDGRIIEHVRKTRAENAKALMREMEEQNEKVEKEQKRKWDDYIETTAAEIFKYGQHKAGEARLI